MAIKNTLLSGTDWTNEVLKAVDLNDTMNAAVNKIKSLTAFDKDSYLYTTYDDFETYSVGAFTTNSLWTVTGTATIQSSTNAGGSGKECRLDGTASLLTKSFVANKHFTFKAKSTWDRQSGGSDETITGGIIFNGVTYPAFTTTKRNNSGADGDFAYWSFTIVAKGSNIYDVYCGASKVASSVSIASPQVTIYASYGNLANKYTYIDDVRQSQY